MKPRDDVYFMRQALKRAKTAAADGEVPVGAVIVCDGKIISSGRNRREKRKNALCHAELEAIGRACGKKGGWRLEDCTLYVTLEPCTMCYGGIINARIKRVVFGAADRRFGVLGSMTDLSQLPFNHLPQISGGILSEECTEILSGFFRELRQTKMPFRKI